MNWILLRGLGRDQRHWLDFPLKLKRNDEKIYCLDLPGFGDQLESVPPITISKHVEYLRQNFLDLNLAHNNTTLVGISLGGMIALDWQSRFSNDFKRIVVINTSCKDLSSFVQRLSLYAFYRILRSNAANSVDKKELQILRMISNLKENDVEVLDKMVQFAKESQYRPEHLLRQLYAASQFVCPSQMKIPTLVLASIKDRMVDVRCSKAIADKLNCQIKFHPQAGHDLTLDDPDWVADRIHEFVETAESSEV